MERWPLRSFSSRPSSACPGTQRGKMAKVRRKLKAAGEHSSGSPSAARMLRGGETSEFSACLGGFFLCVCPGLVARLVVDTVPSACRVTAGCCCVSRRVHRVFCFNSFPPPPDSHATICGHLHSELVRQLKHAGAAFSQGFLFFLYPVLTASHG